MLLARDAVPRIATGPARAGCACASTQALTTQRARLRAQVSGSDLDIDACARLPPTRR
jgi:nitric oxide reductase NorD protein